MLMKSDMTENSRLIYDLNFNDLLSLVQQWGLPRYRAIQIWEGLYRSLWKSPDEFITLPRELRERLSQEFTFQALLPGSELRSSDGETVKTLFHLRDNHAIEAVLMRYKTRRTLCISTQAGCAMGCVFCATGQMGFKRNLSSGEIIEQVLYYARQLKEQGESVSNIVIMGMGEPFHNYEATLRAVDCLNHPEGFNLGARRFTISTVGIIPMIRKFTQENRQVNLAISLHAADDETRASLLPINKKYPISELLSACRDYVSQTHRRITFEWALIRNINDTPEQAHKLAGLLKGLLCHVNVIPLNPTRRYQGEATTRERAEAFCEILNQAGIPSTIRVRRGIDIQAGCGQLATQNISMEG
jgi:23S rRNA (adenine2503-C2)-methyltransferase